CTDAREHLLMLNLSGHDRAMDAFPFEGLDQLWKFTEREPMHSSGAMRFDLGECLLFNGSYDHFQALGAGSVEYEKRKAAVAGNQSKPLVMAGHRGQSSIQHSAVSIP